MTSISNDVFSFSDTVIRRTVVVYYALRLYYSTVSICPHLPSSTRCALILHSFLFMLVAGDASWGTGASLKHAIRSMRIDGNGAAARRAAIKSTNGLIGHWRLSCQARALGSRAYL